MSDCVRVDMPITAYQVPDSVKDNDTEMKTTAPADGLPPL